ncbi:MAG: tyrosine-type recombinase/integrase [Chloroflexi bacterium]|nr:tyrosine-type recombinase/integrase [Chloroflexota bacterium]
MTTPENTPPTTAVRRRRPRGIYPRAPASQPQQRERKLPVYLDQSEVNALSAAAPNPEARLLMLEQRRAGLRVSEALALEIADLHMSSDRPTLTLRNGKGRVDREVPVHAELQNALIAITSFGSDRQGRLIQVPRSTAWRWVQAALGRFVEAGQLPAGRKVGTHTLRPSYARHLLLNGVPINYLSDWLGHADLETTLIYLKLVSDPAGTLAHVS